MSIYPPDQYNRIKFIEELEAEEETFDPAVTDIRPIADNVEGPVTIERAFKLFLP